ncbi:MAG: 30S ribosomal protein S6 [Bacteroidales bacterium]|nr:30S ribosomal protein S6 [Bacteroidales bacterium]MBP5367495.1 30S ribosomal protein S6 [Bacteroidales bacterium]
MQKQYEAVFIMTPVLSDQQMKEAVDKFKAILTDGGAEIVHEENWGLKKLAYPVQHKSTGFYQLLQFKAEPSLIEKFDVELKRDERIIRWLTTALDKHAVEYAAKRAQKRSGQATEQAAPAQETQSETTENKEE